MSFSPQDISILKAAKAEGLTKEQALARLAQSRASSASYETPSTSRPSIMDRVTSAAKGVTGFLGLDGATNVFGRAIARTNLGARITGTDAEANREFIEAPTRKELAGAAIQTAATAASPAIPVPAGLAAKVLTGATAGYAYDIGQNMVEDRSLSETVTPGAGAIIGGIVPGAGPVGRGVTRTAVNAGRAVSNSPVVRGAIQTGVEFGERLPRFVSKRRAELRNAATRAERIANSPAPVGRALTAGVDERIINTIEQADPATRAGYREIVRLAEESIDTTGTLKTTARPEIVAGEAVAEQYKLVDQQRRKIGQAIGEQVQALPKDRVVRMTQVRSELADTLQDAGIEIIDDGKGTLQLRFERSGFTKEQRSKIKELYELATEGGDNLTPAQIHAKDRLFSQLQREARMDKIGDILIDTVDAEGKPIKTSLFQAFRDVYSNTLEEVAPEIRPLNRQYRNLSTFTDDIENSLVKSGKFETNSRVDPSEYAQTNLRRLFSEAQSAADYRAIADELDQAARALGYQGAVPSDLARFAFEIRKIYPETTPRTGIEGVIRSSTSAGNITDAVLNAGRADIEDQQKAVRELLDFLSD